MRGPWPFPGPHGVFGDLFGATFGAGAIVFGIFAAAVVFVAIVALLILVIRFLLATTKAAELYVAERRAAGTEGATPAPAPAPAETVAPEPAAAAAEPAAVKRSGTTTPRARAPRTPRVPKTPPTA